jgi:hypothetical protein
MVKISGRLAVSGETKEVAIERAKAWVANQEFAFLTVETYSVEEFTAVDVPDFFDDNPDKVS